MSLWDQNMKLQQEVRIGKFAYIGADEDVHRLKKENQELEEELKKIKERCVGDGLEYLVDGGEKPKEDTKNVKGNRKIVATNYCGPTAVFKIPDGLDLEDKSVVESWGTKWGTLYIKYVGKAEEEEIKWEWEPDMDFKCGDDEIVDADEWGCLLEYSEDEDEE